MELGRIFDIASAIVGVAMAFVLVSNKNTANIITAGGNVFSNSLKAAIGH